MHCTACDAVNDQNARLCRACGTPLGATAPQYATTTAPMTGASCPTCQQVNPAGARFCVFCATALPQPMTAATTMFGNRVALATATPGGYAAPTTFQPVNGVVYTPIQIVPATMTGAGNLLIRAIWFLLIGWWLGLFWIVGAWLFNLTLIGLPVGLMMLNAVPQVMTLRQRRQGLVQLGFGGQVLAIQRPQHPLALRAIWFVVVGWWASLIWSMVAWSFCASIILMPIAFWMFDRIPTITTLAVEP